MITKVDIQNFKSIKKQTLEDLPPIVGIWGKNGAGKSSFLQAIVWAAKNKGDFNINGLSLGSNENVVFRGQHEGECIVTIVDTIYKDITCKIEIGGQINGASQQLAEIRYFPPWRHISERISNIQNVIKSDFGYRSNDIHAFLHRFLHDLMSKERRGDEEAARTYERLNHWSEQIGFGKLFDTQVGKNVMGTYRDSILEFEIPIVDGGFGGNSFLLILLECYSFKNGIILIEEPEISLHSGAQGDIWEFMMEMVEERGHQIIFTSHSPYLASKIARTLSEDKFKDKVRIYIASKIKQKGTEFKHIPTDEILQRFYKYWDDILPELKGR